MKAERNLFGNLLMLSQYNDIDLESVFAYQLGPVTWSLATCDGGMVKTNKAQLMHHLETECTASSVPSVDKTACVVDGNAVIQSCVGLPEIFTELALQIFNYLPKSPEVYFVTDCYHSHSIKSFERSRRGQSARFCIGGPKTKVPRVGWCTWFVRKNALHLRVLIVSLLPAYLFKNCSLRRRRQTHE